MENSKKDATTETLNGWWMFNEANGINATEIEILTMLNEMTGKSEIKANEILTDFVCKHKAIVIRT